MASRPASGIAPAGPQGRFIENVSALTRGCLRLAKEEGRAAGVSLPQLFLLGSLHDTGPIPVARWVGMFGATPSATTGLLDGLESEGLVVRRHDSSDRRQVLIALSPKGDRLAVQLKARLRARWVDLLEGLAPAELEQASRTLARISERLLPAGHGAPLLVARRTARRRVP